MLKVSRTRFTVAALWLAIVMLMGTSYFAAQKTAMFILPVLKFLAPHASIRQLNVMHLGMRKVAHVTEYGILAVLLGSRRWSSALGARRAWRPGSR